MVQQIVNEKVLRNGKWRRDSYKCMHGHSMLLTRQLFSRNVRRSHGCQDQTSVAQLGRRMCVLHQWLQPCWRFQWGLMIHKCRHRVQPGSSACSSLGDLHGLLMCDNSTRRRLPAWGCLSHAHTMMWYSRLDVYQRQINEPQHVRQAMACYLYHLVEWLASKLNILVSATLHQCFSLDKQQLFGLQARCVIWQCPCDP